ncbi:SDR family NAD(P)-dependent oxidoreductase [Streptomyces phaeochromogenes]|uniref:SDR family NAD(P)-dependent oxidoreductase n=1 Tax=Streptomyces phaeochromogenes TaxID=1923 RepID=UPI00367FE7C8
MERLTNRRALVTGAGSGIGRAVALRLLDEGAHVVAADIARESLDETASLAKRASGSDRLTTVPLDIAVEDETNSAVAGAIQELGGLDILVNAAGILRAAHTHECSLELWNKIITVNLTGTFLVTRAALPSLLDTGRGVVVNFSSTSAQFAHPFMAAYSASKGGILSFTHCLAQEYSKQGLRAVSVMPGSIASGMTNDFPSMAPDDVDWSLIGKLTPAIGDGFAPPETVAGVVAMIVSDDGAFLTGTEIRIDGGTHQ